MCLCCHSATSSRTLLLLSNEQRGMTRPNVATLPRTYSMSAASLMRGIKSERGRASDYVRYHHQCLAERKGRLRIRVRGDDRLHGVRRWTRCCARRTSCRTACRAARSTRASRCPAPSRRAPRHPARLVCRCSAAWRWPGELVRGGPRIVLEHSLLVIRVGVG